MGVPYWGAFGVATGYLLVMMVFSWVHRVFEFNRILFYFGAVCSIAATGIVAGSVVVVVLEGDTELGFLLPSHILMLLQMCWLLVETDIITLEWMRWLLCCL